MKFERQNEQGAGRRSSGWILGASWVLVGLISLACSGAVEPAKDWPEQVSWSDCEGFCSRAYDACDLFESGGSSRMDCLMACDSAAQFEGGKMPNSESTKASNKLRCSVESTDCNSLKGCVGEGLLN